MVRGLQAEMRQGEPSPERAREMVSVLTALQGNCRDELRLADLEHKHNLLVALREQGSGVKARMHAETMPA